MKSQFSSVLLLVALLAFLPAPAVEAQESAYLYWATSNTGEVFRSLTDGSFLESLTLPVEINTLALDVAGQQMFYGGRAVDNSAGAILRADLDGSHQRRILQRDGIVSRIALDVSARQVYWREIEGSAWTIHRANFNGASEELLLSGSNAAFELMELDLVNRTIYLNTLEGIRRANLDGTGLVILNPVTGLRDIEVDASNNGLYLSFSSGLEKCDLDAANCTTLVSGSIGDIEVDGGTVYFQMLVDRSIWSMDLDGNNQQQVSIGLHATLSFALDASQGHFYFPDESIFRSDLDGSNQLPLIAGVGDELHDVAVDGADERLYFSDFHLETVSTAPIDELGALNSIFPGSQAADDLTRIRGLVIDAENDRLFAANWDMSLGNGVWRIDLNGPSRTEIVTGLNRTHDVAYDPVEGKVYWNTDLGNSADLIGRIQRSNADGTGLEDVITGLPQLVRGLDVDSVNRKVYWTDMENGQIRRANLDGSSQELVIGELNKPHDVAVDPVAGRIYWVDAIGDDDNLGAMIRGAGLDGSSPFDVLLNLSNGTRDLTVVRHRNLFIFEDGFESGDTSAWTASTP